MELRAMPWHESIIEAELAKSKVLVNATSIGLTADVSPIPAEILPPDLLVLDLIYNRTRLLRDAEAAGATVSDGELMLLHQGAAAFTLWTGQPAPLELMQQALVDGPRRRRPLGRGRAGRRAGADGGRRGPATGRLRRRLIRPASTDGSTPLADRRRIARPSARRDRRGRARRASRSTEAARRSTSPAASAATAAARARRSSTTAPRSSSRRPPRR